MARVTKNVPEHEVTLTLNDGVTIEKIIENLINLDIPYTSKLTELNISKDRFIALTFKIHEDE